MLGSRRDTMAVVPDPDDASAVFSPLDSLLWTERSLLQRLLYQLRAQELVLRAGRVELLRDSDAEVRELVQTLQLHEVGRAAQAELLTTCYGLPPAAPLQRIVAIAPAIWSAIMGDHLQALRELQDAVERQAALNVELLQVIRDDGGAPAPDATAPDASAPGRPADGPGGPPR